VTDAQTDQAATVAKENEKIADASQAAANEKAGSAYDVAVAKAEGEHQVAVEKCEAQSGNAQKTCKEQADAARDAAKPTRRRCIRIAADRH